jgi:hypothetical protein
MIVCIDRTISAGSRPIAAQLAGQLLSPARRATPARTSPALP